MDSLVLITEPDWFLLALWCMREVTKRESVSVAQSDSFEKRDPLGFFEGKREGGFQFQTELWCRVGRNIKHDNLVTNELMEAKFSLTPFNIPKFPFLVGALSIFLMSFEHFLRLQSVYLVTRRKLFTSL